MTIVKATADAPTGMWLGSKKRVQITHKCRCSPVRRCAPGCKCLTHIDPARAAVYCCARPAPPPPAVTPVPDPLTEPTAVAPPAAEKPEDHVTDTEDAAPTFDRWDVVRAFMASDLTGVQKAIMHALAAIAVVSTCEIPPEFTPSLRKLAKMASWDKSTVVRNLDDLDDGGWIEREKPSLRDAQRYGIRTKYKLTIPGMAGAIAVDGNADPSDSYLVADDNQTMSQTSTTMSQSATTHVADVHHPGRTKRQSIRSSSDQISDQRSSSSEMNLRPDVERICSHLADRMVANGCRRPTITKRWRDSARLMIDNDHLTVDQVIKAIDWSSTDDFWRSNILSTTKLREKYDQLRLAAQRKQGRASPALVDRGGIKVKPETADLLDRRAQWAARDAAAAAGGQQAIGGSP